MAEPNPASLGSALARLVADPALAAELGRAGFERGERITWEETVYLTWDASSPVVVTK